MAILVLLAPRVSDRRVRLGRRALKALWVHKARQGRLGIRVLKAWSAQLALLAP